MWQYSLAVLWDGVHRMICNPYANYQCAAWQCYGMEHAVQLKGGATWGSDSVVRKKDYGILQKITWPLWGKLRSFLLSSPGLTHTVL